MHTTKLLFVESTIGAFIYSFGSCREGFGLLANEIAMIRFFQIVAFAAILGMAPNLLPVLTLCFPRRLDNSQ